MNFDTQTLARTLCSRKWKIFRFFSKICEKCSGENRFFTGRFSVTESICIVFCTSTTKVNHSSGCRAEMIASSTLIIQMLNLKEISHFESIEIRTSVNHIHEFCFCYTLEIWFYLIIDFSHSNYITNMYVYSRTADKILSIVAAVVIQPKNENLKEKCLFYSPDSWTFIYTHLNQESPYNY